VIGTGGIITTGLWAFSNDALLYGWLDVMRFCHPIGLFKYTSDEDMPDAILNSLACIWLPIAAWGTWRLHHRLKKRFV
jgi:hypothetical protein